MPISSALGLLAALIGTTATLLAAWAYIRSQHPPKGELFRTTLTIIIIMSVILGLAVFISRATTITVNGQQTIPVPPLPGSGIPAPSGTTPTSSPTSTPASSPTPTSPIATPTPTPSLSPTPTSPVATPTPTSVPSPSPTSQRKKG